MLDIHSKEDFSENRSRLQEDTRSLMELTTCLGVITTVPSLRFRPKILVSAIRLGRSFDDVFDEAIDRRAAQQAMINNGDAVFEVNTERLVKYQKSWERLISNIEREVKDEVEQERILNNSGLFTKSIAMVENAVLIHPSNDWNIDFVRHYREAICLLWSVYLVSLAPDELLNLKEPSLEAGINGPKTCYESILTTNNSINRMVKKLYTGSLVYQIIGDKLSLRDEKHFIPGFRSIVGSSSFELDNLQREYIKSARDCGMSIVEELGLVHIFPLLRKALNKRNG